MPFDIAPQRQAGIYQKYADALLRGCQITQPARGGVVRETRGIATHACAWMAMGLGMGLDSGPMGMEHADLMFDYARKYGRNYIEDYISCGFTREQIAARIAAI